MEPRLVLKPSRKQNAAKNQLPNNSIAKSTTSVPDIVFSVGDKSWSRAAASGERFQAGVVRVLVSCTNMWMQDGEFISADLGAAIVALHFGASRDITKLRSDVLDR